MLDGKVSPEVKAAWVESLVSGKYNRGEAVLKLSDDVCRTGLLCDIYEKSIKENP